MKSLFSYILIVTSFVSFGQSVRKEQPKESLAAPDTATVNFKIPQHLRAIVQNIAIIDEVQSKYIGDGGAESDNYRNYLQLQKLASTKELVSLTYDTNSVVACYASWALADESYPDLPAVFAHFLKNDKVVQTLRGCIKSTKSISTELYYRYWNKVDEKAKADDRLLSQLDSTIIYTSEAGWLLKERAFQNRVYPPCYNDQIENLAFLQNSIEAVFYLCDWYRAANSENLKKALIERLQETDYSKSGTDEYYRILDELLRFRDAEIKPVIIKKLKDDQSWKNSEPWSNDEVRFKALARSYDIYEID
ncbi:hypothetical protein [Taibaiella soli]|uniref:Uncharacterized protein n=1 Tax=Taibaiella soli TaxID=1649169 RepID=A0A2W2AGB6_9BACT|nr:hypothetical protein [Taibaiella soli]PZF72562.1 hypothetical protein DN068_11905 [Taibaiella soli]